MSEFYVSLHSNACSSIFPNNKTSDFRNKLSNPIHLSPGEWEVSLFDISYIHGHVMIPKNEKLASVVFYKGKDLGTGVDEWHSTRDIRSVTDLLEELKTVLKLKNAEIKNRIVSLTFDAVYIGAVYFTEKVSAILGLEHEPIVINPYHYDPWAENWKTDEYVKAVFRGRFNVYDMAQFTRKYAVEDKDERRKNGVTVIGYTTVFENAGWTNLFVYCDIIRPQYVADVLANCLKVVPYKGSYGEICHHSFVQPQFVDISVSSLEVIHISVLSETGSRVSFDYSPVSLTLKFRQKRVR